MASENSTKFKFKGHETFVLRDGWINKGLSAVADNQGIFREYFGADALGVGPNMAKAIRYWLKTAGLTQTCSGGVELTDTGRLILDNDQYIEDPFTLWILHINIACNKSEATAWNLFFNEFDMDEFTKEQLQNVMISLAGRMVGTDKTIAEKSVSSDCDAILQMYVKRHIEDYDPEEKKVCPFQGLGLVRLQNGKYAKVQPSSDSLTPMAVWYALNKYADEADKIEKAGTSDQNSISIDRLLTAPDSPGRILNLKRTSMLGYISRFADDDLLTLNQTAGLDMVYLKEKRSLEEIVKEYYRGK